MIIEETNKLLLINEIIDGKSNPQLSQLFSLLSRDSYNLRSNNCALSLPKSNTNLMKRSFSYRGVVV